MSFLTVENIHHSYFTPKTVTTALKDINFSVEKGEFISLVSTSGCGKTTMLSILSGLIQPTQGSVIIDGQSPDNQVRSIGYMLQQDYLFPGKRLKKIFY